MTTPSEHINELLSAENLALKEEMETLQLSYNDFVSTVEQHLADYIVETDVAAIAIYCDAIERAAKALPKWTFLKNGGYPEDGQIVIAAYVDSDGNVKSVEARWEGWEDSEWATPYPCLDIDGDVYAWAPLLTPPNLAEEV